jgi:hypothetical protein
MRIVPYDVTQACGYHVIAETTMLKFFMPSENETLPYTYFSLLLLGEQTTCFYLPNQSIYVYHNYYFPKQIIISCTRKQQRRGSFSSIFSSFQLIFPNCTLMTNHLTLSNMKKDHSVAGLF